MTNHNVKLFVMAAFVAAFALVGGFIAVSEDDSDASAICKITLVSNIEGEEYEPLTLNNGEFLVEADGAEHILAPSFPGKVFLGWYTDKGFKSPINYTMKITGDMTFYAKWQDEATQYCIVLRDSTNSDIFEIDTIVVQKNALAEKPSNPTKAGYKFAGWYTMEVDEETMEISYVEFDFKKAVDSNKDVYATWEKSDSGVFDFCGVNILLVIFLVLGIGLVIYSAYVQNFRVGAVGIILLVLACLIYFDVFNTIVSAIDDAIHSL